MGELDADHDGLYDENEAGDGETPPFWSVAIYLVDKAFGGPEEGGWWFDVSVRVDELLPDLDAEYALPRFFVEHNAAADWAATVNLHLAAGPNNGRRDIGSVLSEGVYVAYVHPGYPVHHTPERTPRYE